MKISFCLDGTKTNVGPNVYVPSAVDHLNLRARAKHGRFTVLLPLAGARSQAATGAEKTRAPDVLEDAAAERAAPAEGGPERVPILICQTPELSGEGNLGPPEFSGTSEPFTAHERELINMDQFWKMFGARVSHLHAGYPVRGGS
jgi:hypothetical protein